MLRGLRILALIILVVCLGSLGQTSVADPAQAAALRRIGMFLVSFSPDSKEIEAFRRALLNAGYVEGRDVMIEWRTAKGDYGQIAESATELVRSNVDVIVTDSTVGTLALKRATSTIPIVMAAVADPVGSGFVTSLAHPGGNITGLSTMIAELSVKRLQLLKEAIPRVVRAAVVWNPDTTYASKVVEDLKAVAPALSIELKFFGVRTREEFSPAFTAIGREHAQAVYVIGDALFNAHRSTFVGLATKAGLPTFFSYRVYVDQGGLMSYGPSFSDMFGRSSVYVDRILKGAKPGDLPIEQPTQFELVVNLKTAKAIGLTVPESILLRADEVIR